MKKLISLLVLVGILGVSAFTLMVPKPQYSEITFPVMEELKGRTISIDSVMFRYPYRLEVRKDRVVIEDLHGADHYFHLFSYPDFRYLSSFGKHGEAPDEMLTVDDFRWNGQTLWALDNIKSELVRWELNKNRDGMIRSERIKLDKATFRALDVVPYQNNTFLIPDYSGENRFCQVDRNGKLLKKWGEIPADDKNGLEKAPYAFGQGWRSFTDYSPKTGTLVAVTQLGEVLEIWNVKKNTQQVVKGKFGDPKFEIVQNYAIPSGVSVYNDVQVTDRAIYLVYEGKTFKEIHQNRRKGKSFQDGGKIVRVFSLDGKPLKQYVLDHAVNGIWVMEEEGKMLALDVNSDEPIVEYTIR